MRSKADETLVIVETLICPLQISFLDSLILGGSRGQATQVESFKHLDPQRQMVDAVVGCQRRDQVRSSTQSVAYARFFNGGVAVTSYRDDAKYHSILRHHDVTSLAVSI